MMQMVGAAEAVVAAAEAEVVVEEEEVAEEVAKAAERSKRSVAFTIGAHSPTERPHGSGRLGLLAHLPPLGQTRTPPPRMQ